MWVSEKQKSLESAPPTVRLQEIWVQTAAAKDTSAWHTARGQGHNFLLPQTFTCYVDDEEIRFEDLLVDDSLTLDKQGISDQLSGYLHPLLVVPENGFPVGVDEGILLEKTTFSQVK